MVTETVIVTLIASIPPTIAAVAALVQVRRLSNPIAEVNAAVNHRRPGERRLVEMVDDIAGELHQIRHELSQHRAWHQLRDEQEEDQP